MSDIVVPADASVAPEDESTLASILAEMNDLRSQIDLDQREINRLKEECRTLKAETRAMIDALKKSLLPC